MREPRRVIVVCDYACVMGGVSKVAIHSAIALAHKEYDTYYFFAVGPIADELTAAPLTVYCLEQRESLQESSRLVGAQKGLWNLTTRSAFDRFLQDFSPTAPKFM